MSSTSGMSEEFADLISGQASRLLFRSAGKQQGRYPGDGLQMSSDLSHSKASTFFGLPMRIVKAFPANGLTNRDLEWLKGQEQYQAEARRR